MHPQKNWQVDERIKKQGKNYLIPMLIFSSIFFMKFYQVLYTTLNLDLVLKSVLDSCSSSFTMTLLQNAPYLK